MAAPTDFIFSVKYAVGSKIFYNMSLVYNINDNIHKSVVEYQLNGTSPLLLQACPKNGYHVLDGITLWVVNREKNNSMYLYFKSKQDWIDLNKKIDDKVLLHNLKYETLYKIYKYCAITNRWNLQDNYSFKGENDLIGQDKFVQLLDKDINNIKKYTNFLTSIGEAKSNNYFLYGPPGTGKTTLIKTLASKHNIPIFIVNPNSLNLSHIDNILNPKILNVNCSSQFKLLLFEDFDRFFENRDAQCTLSSILNGLDGLENTSGVIRFFTANNPDVIFKIPALINRMCAKFEFEFPSRIIFEGKLKRLLSYYESYNKEKFNKYIDLVVAKHITVRPFTNYTLRYMFDDNYLDCLINNINELN